MLSWSIPSLRDGLVVICNPNWGWCLCIAVWSNCMLVCSAPLARFSDVQHVHCQCTLLKNHPPPMWIELVVCHASIDPVPIFFACIYVHLVVFLVAGWQSILLAGGRAYLCWLQCRHALFKLIFLLDDILWWSPPGCLWLWVVCILVAAVVSSDRSWICPLSWILPPVLILCC